MIVYISGPMTGIPNFNYPAFGAAEARLRAAGFEVRNPVDSEKFNDTGAPQSWDWYMRHALRMVLESDAVGTLPGWSKSRGATLEINVAEALGMPVRSVEEWLVPVDAMTAEGLE